MFLTLADNTTVINNKQNTRRSSQSANFFKSARDLTFVLALFFLLMFVCSGCTTYSESFTYYGPGGTNHTLTISHNTFLVYGKASKLATETQTGEFIRTVNAEGLQIKTDSDAVKAITKGITEGLLKTIKPTP